MIDSQNARILNDLKAGKSITPIDGLNNYNCFRLGARICDLRRRGYEIRTEIIKNNGKRYAKYTMEQK